MFELLLRLRANYLWPAMWGSMFNVDDYANQPLADAFGVVLGSSHTGKRDGQIEKKMKLLTNVRANDASD